MSRPDIIIFLSKYISKASETQIIRSFVQNLTARLKDSWGCHAMTFLSAFYDV